jgi:hypothetical protein
MVNREELIGTTGHVTLWARCLLLLIGDGSSTKELTA